MHSGPDPHRPARPRPPAGAALLTCAVRGGSSEMVAVLLLTGVTTPAKCGAAGESPVQVAAYEGFVDALHYLQGTGFDMTGGCLRSCG